MKNFVAAALMCACASTAFGKTIATYEFNKPNYVGVPGPAPAGASVIDATLSDDGVLTLTEKDYASFTELQQPVAVKNASEKLDPEAFGMLKYEVEEISGDEIVTTTYQVICDEIGFSAASQNLYVATNFNYQTNTFDGGLELAYSEQACYLATRTAPKDAYVVQAANTLESNLIVLGLEALSKN